MRPFDDEAKFQGIVTSEDITCCCRPRRAGPDEHLSTEVVSERKNVKNLCRSPRSRRIKKDGG